MMSEVPLSCPVRTRADYLQGPHGRLFVTSFWPADSNSGQRVIIILAPFAEEMNKSRRMLALQGRALAARGLPAVVPDVIGTGDSERDFEDGTWEGWNRDIVAVIEWLRSQRFTRVDFLGLRTGIFLAARALVLHAQSDRRIALWSPVIRGAKMMDHLFRANRFRQSGELAGAGVAETRTALGVAGGLEVGGYWISKGLLDETDALDLSESWSGGQGAIRWLDVGGVASLQPPRSALPVMERMSAVGASVDYERMSGRQFWLGPEIETIPELIQATTRFFVE